MPSPSLIDIEALLTPISDEAAAGSDCREDPSPTSYYQQVKSARNSARASERNNVYSDSSDEADEHWRTVIGLAPKIIAEQSKDLEVICWYSEAMIRRYGFTGLRDAFVIMKGLVDNFWDNLYPMPDEDGIETRVSSISGLNGEGAEGVLLAPIRNTLITEGSSVGPFSYWEYQQAVEAGRIISQDSREEKIKKLGFSVDTVLKAVSESSDEFFINIRDDLNEAITAFKALSLKLDELCGPYDAPPTRNIIEILEECLGAINHIAEDKFPIEIAAEEETTSADSDTPAASGSSNNSGGPVTTKEQAYRQILSIADFLRKSDSTSPMPYLLEQAVKTEGAECNILAREHAFKQLRDIAEYFRRTEPHSPISYVLEKAVKWGNMPLNELIRELIPESAPLKHFTELTGVETEE